MKDIAEYHFLISHISACCARWRRAFSADGGDAVFVAADSRRFLMPRFLFVTLLLTHGAAAAD